MGDSGDDSVCSYDIYENITQTADDEIEYKPDISQIGENESGDDMSHDLTEFIDCNKQNDSGDDDMECSSPNPIGNTNTNKLVPEISRKRYDQNYREFMDWRNHNNLNSLSENVLLTYFQELSKTKKSSTLWSQYSMLKTSLSVKDNVDITSYGKLRSFLKQQAKGYQAKKSKTLTSQEIHKFLNEAPDEKYLLIKVALIMGIRGACNREELSKLKVEYLRDLGNAYLVQIPDRKTKTSRTFTVAGSFYEICKKYMRLRPSNLDEERLFLNYENGKCTKTVVGINKFGSMPKQIALYLKLPNPEEYTGHCFRRSSPTILVDSSSSTSSSTAAPPNAQQPQPTIKIIENLKSGQTPAINIYNCTNVTICNYYSNL